MPATSKIFSLIVPVYKNEESVSDLIVRVIELSKDLDQKLEVIFVIDSSPDNSFKLIQDAVNKNNICAQIIVLSRNFGSFAAIRMGLQAAKGDYFVAMSADLQEPKHLITDLFKAISQDGYDISIGTRAGREDAILDRFSSWIFWTIYRKFVQSDIPPGGVDIFGCTRKIRDLLLGMQESNSSLVGLLFWIGFNKKCVPYERQKRQHGKSAWSLKRKIRYLFDSCFSFSDLPITLLLVTGALGILFSCVAAIIVVIAYLSGIINMPGYTPIILAILLFCAIDLFAIGIVGAYVWRTYENSKHRPLHLPMYHESFNS